MRNRQISIFMAVFVFFCGGLARDSDLNESFRSTCSSSESCWGCSEKAFITQTTSPATINPPTIPGTNITRNMLIGSLALNPHTQAKKSETMVKVTKIALKVTLCARVFILFYFLSFSIAPVGIIFIYKPPKRIPCQHDNHAKNQDYNSCYHNFLFIAVGVNPKKRGCVLGIIPNRAAPFNSD